jgi:hypothetical protein
VEVKGTRPADDGIDPLVIGGAICASVKPILMFNATAYIEVSCSQGYEISMLVEEARQLKTVLESVLAEWDGVKEV